MKSINKNECNIKVKTYGDVIRHMTNSELALFLSESQSDIELGIIAIMRAKMYPHRKSGEEPRVKEKTGWDSFYNFMEHRVNEEDYNYGDVWGVENWQDLMQWESTDKKNFGVGVEY